MSKDTHSISERKTKTVQPDMNTSIAWEKMMVRMTMVPQVQRVKTM